MMIASYTPTLIHQSLKRLRPCLLVALSCLIGISCGNKESNNPDSSSASSTNTTPGQDAYLAAQRLVGLSLRPSATTTITFGQPKRDYGAGYEKQEDKTWKTWGWVDLPDVSGKSDRQYWQAVMHQMSEGRRWRASWLKIGSQESGTASTWQGDPPPEQPE